MDHEEEEVREVRRRGRAMGGMQNLAANMAKFHHQKTRARITKKQAALAAIPEAAVPSKKMRVRKVPLTDNKTVIKDATIVKRGRGRPKGSVGMKKREAQSWLDSESRKIDAVRL